MKQKIKAETKTNRGITLITLVITIVVILILSAVAINAISGDNGVLQKAALAKRNTEKAQEKEIDKLDEIGGIMTDFKSYYNS